MTKPSRSTVKKDEWVRTLLTVYTTAQALLLILFFGTAPFVRLRIKQDEALGVVELVLPLLTGYVGMILGYYFGHRDAK